ncbi:MAG: DinB family protein [Armatimonadota bacterium]|nr:DinB family protein [Armatimonadota bacterium]
MALDPLRLYEYLTKARRRLLDWVRPLTHEQYTREFPFGLKTVRATLVEMARAEWIYMTRLAGETVPPREQWPITEDRYPTFVDLETAWLALEPRTRATLAAVNDWTQQREWRATVSPPGKILYMSATPADMVAQFLFHEVHHRAQAMAMLRQFGVAAQNLDYSVLMFAQREVPA